MTLQLDRPLVVLDTETTGTDPEIDRIVQIGLIVLDDSEDAPRDEHSWLINPGEPIPPESTKIHGIRDEDVKSAPHWREIWKRLEPILRDADICAYNTRFDLSMIRAECKRIGVDWVPQHRVIDPMQLFRRDLPHTLTGAVAYYLGREHTDAHDALADCRAALDVLEEQVDGYLDWNEIAAKSAPDPDDRYCDSGRKFYWRFGRPHHAQGKYRGKPIEYDLSYLDWMVGPRGIPDLPADTRALIEFALAGGVVMNQSSKGIP